MVDLISSGPNFFQKTNKRLISYRSTFLDEKKYLYTLKNEEGDISTEAEVVF